MNSLSESSPLLPQKITNSDCGVVSGKQQERTNRRSAPRCFLLCLAPGFFLLAVFIIFRCIVSLKMTLAWQEAFRLPQSSNRQSALWTVDPLQGARPEFHFSSSASDTIESSRVPLVIVHGVEITARDMDREAELLSRLMPGTYVQSVEYAPGVVTYFTPLDEQLEALCQRLRLHHVFGKAKEVDLLGPSSGALMARAVAQNASSCFGRLDVRVRHYIGIAGHNRVSLRLYRAAWEYFWRSHPSVPCS